MYRKRNLNATLSCYFSRRFPYVKKVPTCHYRYQTLIGIGGNVGDVKRRFERLFVFFQREKRVEIVQTGLTLKNPPFGYVDQDDFFNSVMVLQTSMNPKEFLRYLLHVEKLFGRKRSFANAPRTLDLDIVFFDNKTIQTKALTVPHPHWHERESVLVPLLGCRL